MYLVLIRKPDDRYRGRFTDMSVAVSLDVSGAVETSFWCGILLSSYI